MQVALEGSLNYINVFHFENQVIDGIDNSDPEYVVINLSSALFVDMDGLIALEKIFSKKPDKIAIIVAN